MMLLRKIFSKQILTTPIILDGSTYATEAEIPNSRVTLNVATSPAKNWLPSAVYLRVKGKDISGGQKTSLKLYFAPLGALFTEMPNSCLFYAPGSDTPIIGGLEPGGSGVGITHSLARAEFGAECLILGGDEIFLTLEEDRTSGQIDEIEIIFYGP